VVEGCRPSDDCAEQYGDLIGRVGLGVIHVTGVFAGKRADIVALIRPAAFPKPKPVMILCAIGSHRAP